MEKIGIDLASDKDYIFTQEVHVLKTWPKYFQAIIKGDKTFEVRRKDRNYKVGNILNLLEFDPVKNDYTGKSIMVRVTYILDEGPYMPRDYLCMAIKVMNKSDECGNNLKNKIWI